jgi:sulfatase modifying factor 1
MKPRLLFVFFLFPLLCANSLVQSGRALSSGYPFIMDPPYGLKKVEAAIRKMLPSDGSFPYGQSLVLKESVYSSFSLAEKFTYNMIHAETYSQMCTIQMPRGYEPASIYGQMTNLFGEYSWSDRQLTFFTANRDSVQQLMKTVIEKEGQAGVNFLEVIVLINAKEMIPCLIDAYHKNTSNRYILTTLMLLMSNNKYPGFVHSDFYNKLYNRQTDGYSAYLAYSKVTEESIIRQAINFYHSLPNLVDCGPSVHPARAAHPKNDFVLVPKGSYRVGRKDSPQNPLRTVHVDNFRIAVFETTNRQFAAFVAATGYKTDAERLHNAMVFKPGLEEFQWIMDSTAWWRWPNGTGSGGIADRMDHPVTCISYKDVQAYCVWAGVRLPTLEEWEIACRAGTQTDYFFGSEDSHIGEYANIWHGHDHLKADQGDAYIYTAPVGSFRPNPWGLYDMYGNVFEFCTGKVSHSESPTVAHGRGGSWWCSKNSCHSFNSYSIGSVNVHASFSNQGFRAVKS